MNFSMAVFVFGCVKVLGSSDFLETEQNQCGRTIGSLFGWPVLVSCSVLQRRVVLVEAESEQG